MVSLTQNHGTSKPSKIEDDSIQQAETGGIIAGNQIEETTSLL